MSATMMNHHSRRQIITPGPSNNNKRKERDGLDGLKPSVLTTKDLAKPSIHRAHTPVNKSSSPRPQTQTQPQPQPGCNNQLLAGYLAHEFLTKGTLFGEPWDPARAEAVPLCYRDNTANKEKRKAEPPSEKDEKQRVEKQQRYLDVADLLRGGGAHLPGIVNPTQLARFLQLG